MSRYTGYVERQTDALAVATRKFVRAVESGDAAAARRTYPPARVHYERVEPVAEIWGRLDLRIDGRVNDFVPRSDFTGFHRLEQQLWTRGDSPPHHVASDLLASVTRLRRLVRTERYTPLELTTGATELLNEVQSSKVTGEEERYSHLDLLDFAANIAGVREVISVLTPALRSRDPKLLATITRRLRQLDDGLAEFRAAPGYDRSGYVDYSTVGTAQRRRLAALVQSVAEPVALLTDALTS